MSRTIATQIAVWPLLVTVALWLPASLHGGSFIEIDELESELATDYNATTTYDKYLPKAQADNADFQYLLGFMFLHGEGVPVDYEQAHQWLHLAADNGHKVAQRLLGIIHSRGLKRIPESLYDPNEAKYWFGRITAGPVSMATLSLEPHDYAQLARETDARPGADPESGRSIFIYYCATCHGVDGWAAYPSAPSFARGERLDKSNRELLHSIINGKGLMPAWGETVSEQLARNALGYIRLRFARPESEPPEGFATPGRTLKSLSVEGEKTYVTFCSGCHGFNGIAYYVHSPSFALGERMDKSDAELIRSIRNGKGEMPGWGEMISEREMRGLLTFIRSLAPAYEAGLIGEIRAPKGPFFLFKTQLRKAHKWLPSQGDGGGEP